MDLGYENDFGLKKIFDWMIYVSKNVFVLLLVGLLGIGEKGLCVVIKNGKVLFLIWNLKENCWGIVLESCDIEFLDKLMVGLFLFELWDWCDDV